MLLFSAGMWNASAGTLSGPSKWLTFAAFINLVSPSAFLPSSFAMYTTTLAFSYAMEPVSSKNHRRTILATLMFAAGGIVGWPFALALAIPFVVEELFIFGADHVPLESRRSWVLARWKRLCVAGAVAALLFVGTVSYAILHCVQAYSNFRFPSSE